MRGDRIWKAIDTINDKIGRFICFALIFMALIQVMEVILRYVFNSPTIWAWDVNGQLFVGTAMLGGGYALLHNTHVRIDLLYGRVSPRTRVIFDLIVFPLIIMAFIIVIWKASDMGWSAWESKARAPSYFAPILWPVKSVLGIATFLMLLQAIANYTRTIASFFRKPVSKSQQVNQ